MAAIKGLMGFCTTVLILLVGNGTTSTIRLKECLSCNRVTQPNRSAPRGTTVNWHRLRIMDQAHGQVCHLQNVVSQGAFKHSTTHWSKISAKISLKGLTTHLLIYLLLQIILDFHLYAPRKVELYDVHWPSMKIDSLRSSLNEWFYF